MKLVTEKRLRLLLFFLYFFVASRYLPTFQLALFIPFLALSVDTSSWKKSVWIGICLGAAIDLISFSYPMGFYTIPFACIAFFMCKVKGRIAMYKPLPVFAFITLCSVLTNMLILFLSPLFGHRFTYEAKYYAIDLLYLPFLDACIGIVILLAIPYFLKKKFYIEIIAKRITKRRHG